MAKAKSKPLTNRSDASKKKPGGTAPSLSSVKPAKSILHSAYRGKGSQQDSGG